MAQNIYNQNTPLWHTLLFLSVDWATILVVILALVLIGYLLRWFIYLLKKLFN
ncbi:hypothetical protein BDD43_2497 [Mucilaginibacter gracilis]|uniref:Uncharacterized protein n=1 Tax=Mucilaginibacter gracilis TaxID=423350 RepID=A0A495J125_9SPHI|nr:hypothetical protein BDD43_2497 [Mucilaginibacter gracilis]